MAFDGITIANLAKDLKEELVGARIFKITQPEEDELQFVFKGTKSGSKRLFISVSPSLPIIYFTEENKPSPFTAPNFCMFLRKHIGNGRLVDLYQPDMERILVFVVEHFDEMGDLCRKELIVELMGKHSNIIFVNEEHKILDSIKHIPASVSSLREVLPGRPYFIPKTGEKLNPLTVSQEDFLSSLIKKDLPLEKALYQSFTGISPLLARSMIDQSGLDARANTKSISEDFLRHLYHFFKDNMTLVEEENFHPQIYEKDGDYIEYSSIPLSGFDDCQVLEKNSISDLLSDYYKTKVIRTRMRQKSADLRHLVSQLLEKEIKKLDLQERQLADTGKMEKDRIYGELIKAYAYTLPEQADSLICQNYYDDNKEIEIKLDKNLTPMENSQKYFSKYAKAKRTASALSSVILETKETVKHLESVQTSLEFAMDEASLLQIREELEEYGFIKKHVHGKKKGKVEKSQPYHYQTPDGYDLYVGKNNYQNEELTFHFANNNDWWFHAKGIPGSHVIVKSKDKKELPDSVFEAAAGLAAYYSKNSKQGKVEIDYVQKRELRKVTGAAPGFVIYHTNYSMMIAPSIKGLNLLS